MSITLKTNQVKLKIQNGNYQSPVVIADQTTSEHVAEVNTAITTTGNQQVSAIQTKGNEVLNSIPEDYTDLVEDVGDLKSALSKIDGKFYDRKYLYKSTGNATDYTSGVAQGNVLLLWKSEGWYNKQIPYFVPKGSIIRSVKFYKSNANHTAGLVLLKRQSTTWSFEIVRVDNVVSNTETDLNIVADDDYFIGVTSVTENAVTIGSVSDASDGYYLTTSMGSVGDTIAFTNMEVTRGINFDILIDYPINDGVKINTVTVGADKVFTNPVNAVQAINALNDSNKSNVYNVVVDSGEWNLIQYLGGTTWLNSLTENDYMAGLFPNNYVNIKGLGNCVFKTEIADNVATLLMSKQVSTINLRYNNEIENISFIAKNVRYACHDETGGTEYEGTHNKLRKVTNCIFTHLGNAEGLWASPIGYASGFQYGDVFDFKNCTFTSLSFHDQTPYVTPSEFFITNCTIMQTLKFGSVASGRKHRVHINNTCVGRSIQNIEETSGSGVGNGFIIDGSGNTMVSLQYDDKIPVFADECYYKTSGSNSSISKGTPLKHQFGAVLPMTSADDLSKFAGIAMEEIPANGTGYGLVKRHGYVKLSDIGILTQQMFDSISVGENGLEVGTTKVLLFVNGMTKDFAEIII